MTFLEYAVDTKIVNSLKMSFSVGWAIKLYLFLIYLNLY